jgi:cytochrome P450
MPPVAIDAGMPWDTPAPDPVAALAEARRSLGDTFVVESGDDCYVFTFSAMGVKSFYALPEERASKGVADWRMLRRKLPDEMFAGRRILPHQLFGREDVAAYLHNVQRALDDTFLELGHAGDVDVFELTRRLGHRVGLASWGGPGSATGQRFDRLAQAFDALDGSESFVHPDAMAEVAATAKAAEYEALAVITGELGDALRDLPGRESDHPLFARVAAAWADEAIEDSRVGVARDVALIHIASMSNLFAAMGWCLVDVLSHPDEAQRVRAGDQALAEACALESIRLAQRSIMARYVIAPVTLDVGISRHDVAPGVIIATFLPLTNASAAPGLEVWDPSNWNRRRLADTSELEAVELVTAFGHGRHTCPAQPFSLSAMTTTVSRLLVDTSCIPAGSIDRFPYGRRSEVWRGRRPRARSISCGGRASTVSPIGTRSGDTALELKLTGRLWPSSPAAVWRRSESPCPREDAREEAHGDTALERTTGR